MDYISEFVDFMNSHGIEIFSAGDIKADGVAHRIRLDSDSKGQTSCIYKLSINEYGASGRVTSFKHGGETVYFTAKSKGYTKWTPEQKEAWKAKIAEEKRLDREVAEAGYEAAAARAQKIWKKAKLDGNSEYLSRKQIGQHGTKYYLNVLTIPVWHDGKIVSLQFISADGSKRFLKDGLKTGGFFPLTTAKESKENIILCEGFATAASIREATGWPVICCFDCGNLKPVAISLKKKYPTSNIILCSDNDQY